MRYYLFSLFFAATILIGCQSVAVEPPGEQPAVEAPEAVEVSAVVEAGEAPQAQLPVIAAPAAVFPTSSPAPTPTLIPTATTLRMPTPMPQATAVPSCDQRMPADDLLVTISKTYGISREYAPADLVPLADYLPVNVTLGYPSEIRNVALGPLLQMIEEMQAAGFHPQVKSVYRSYAAQAIAWNKWLAKYPDRVSILSAEPGHSEHQLGTAVDFGSPELESITGQPGIEFHTYFDRTSEGRWLAANAHKYGFTLSYTQEAVEITGFAYEPWHFRYVGVDTATQLYEMGITLTEFQLSSQPEPCLP